MIVKRIVPSVWNRDWKYIPASKTDISKTFARERKRLAEEASHQPPSNVRDLSDAFRQAKK